MNYLKISLIVAFGLFTLICVGYANSKFTPKRPSHSASATCSAPESLTCDQSKSVSARD
jgi:hypothetical protein